MNRRARAWGGLLAAGLVTGVLGCSPGVDVNVTVYVSCTGLDPFAAADKIRIEAIGIDEESGQPEILKSREYRARAGHATLGLIKFSAGMQIRVEVLDVEGDVVGYGASALHDILAETPEEDVPAEIAVFLTPVGRIVRAERPDCAESIMPTGRIGHTATLLEDGRVLVTGGALAETTLGDIDPMTIVRSADIYDPESGKFVTVTDGLGLPNPLTVPRAFHTATLLPDGAVLLVGGLTVSAGMLSTVATGERFEYPGCILPGPADILQTAPCAVIPNANTMVDARGRHTATLRPDGSVLIVGGSTEIMGMPPVHLATTELWTASGGFAATGAAPMSDERSYHTATLLPDGQVLVTGGVALDAAGMPEVVETVELFTGTGWMGLGAMTTPRAGHTASLATVESGEAWVIVTGGYTMAMLSGTNTVFSMPTPLVESFEPGVGFDPALARIIEGQPGGIADHSASVLPDGRIVILGGKTGGSLSTSFVSVITPRTNGPSFLSDPLTTLGMPRALHRAVTLASGQVIAIGGFFSSGMTPVTHANAEVYTPPIPR